MKIMGDWKYKRLESSVLVVAKKNSTHEQGLTLLVGFEEEATTCFGKFRHPQDPNIDAYDSITSVQPRFKDTKTYHYPYR